MKTTAYISIFIIGAVCFTGLVQAEMYKWTDENGKTHYTQTPPPASVESKDIEADIRLSTGKLGNEIPSTQPNKESDEMEEARKAGAKSEKKHQVFCAQQQAALKQMSSNSLIKWKDAEGERYLTAEEKESKMVEIEKNINNMCRPEMFKQDRKTSEKELAQNKLSGKENDSFKSGSSSSDNGSRGAVGSTGNNGGTTEIQPLPSAD